MSLSVMPSARRVTLRHAYLHNGSFELRSKNIPSTNLQIQKTPNDSSVRAEDLQAGHPNGTMAATDVGVRNVPPIDDLDDSLFDYDVGDVFRDVETNMDVPTMQKPVAKAVEKEHGAGLGIDEEIKVTKKRAPVPKLDENRFVLGKPAMVD